METGREVERRELRSGKGPERATGKVRLRAGRPIAHERAERRSSGTVSRREGTRMRGERKGGGSGVAFRSASPPPLTHSYARGRTRWWWF